ncbi:MAG: hypothetical protein H8D47_00600 [Planctomycetes bacterium]|nr:hypothetical protein [Planctomycetota bacterium]
MLKTPIQIKLLIAGINQAELAVKLDTTPTTICNVVTFKSHNIAIQEAIANILNEPPEPLWGIEYAPRWYKRHSTAGRLIPEAGKDKIAERKRSRQENINKANKSRPEAG